MFESSLSAFSSLCLHKSSPFLSFVCEDGWNPGGWSPCFVPCYPGTLWTPHRDLCTSARSLKTMKASVFMPPSVLWWEWCACLASRGAQLLFTPASLHRALILLTSPAPTFPPGRRLSLRRVWGWGGHVWVGFPASRGRKTEALMNTETPEKEENMNDRWRNNSLETINCFSCGLKLVKTVFLKTPNFKSGSNLITLSWAPTWVWPAGPCRDIRNNRRVDPAAGSSKSAVEAVRSDSLSKSLVSARSLIKAGLKLGRVPTAVCRGAGWSA